MPRAKVARKSTAVDMTAMTDVTFLLLTFFMLATKFTPVEPVAVVTPSSINTQILPDSDVILLTVDKKGRIFFEMDGQPKRKKLIEDLDQQFHLGLSESEKNSFMIGGGIGTDLKHLKSYLAMKPDQRRMHPIETGIPADSANNELGIWIEYGNSAQQNNLRQLRYCIKADNETPYPQVKRVLDTFKEKKIQKVNLVTNLEAAPEGSLAAIESRKNN
ncbi:ExbD/TolR family protein [Chitinophaga arvensicola]|uniref:Biopolymer transport protein ExbD/TolR n=1 Tax=Chitinophaga arvensicola TaxID=29529 RepID=A0A1I0S914_9BACT|nr:biopolymer transporter ExbD [Chitinophaga arvensicola]SEW52651.1 Biopolymer transport protein ExbD/TolR [Chitinophaga arvensicola]